MVAAGVKTSKYGVSVPRNELDHRTLAATFINQQTCEDLEDPRAHSYHFNT